MQDRDYITHTHLGPDTAGNTSHLETYVDTEDVSGPIAENIHAQLANVQADSTLLANQTNVVMHQTQQLKRNDDALTHSVTQEISNDVPIIVRMIMWIIIGGIGVTGLAWILHTLATAIK